MLSPVKCEPEACELFGPGYFESLALGVFHNKKQHQNGPSFLFFFFFLFLGGPDFQWGALDPTL